MRNAGLERATSVARSGHAPALGSATPSGDGVDPPLYYGGLAVETLAPVDRVVGRLESTIASQPDETDVARAQEYALLSVLLARAPDAGLLSRLAQLRGDASPLGLAHAALAEAASRASAEHLEREYFDLFIGLGRGELLPYGSYYMSGFLHERPLARLRAYLSELRIERTDNEHEPEDHAAIVCEIMAGIVSGRLPAPAGADRKLFEDHLAAWLGRFFADLERAEAADFYRHVGTLGRVFIEIEAQAFALPS